MLGAWVSQDIGERRAPENQIPAPPALPLLWFGAVKGWGVEGVTVTSEPTSCASLLLYIRVGKWLRLTASVLDVRRCKSHQDFMIRAGL